MHLEEQVSTLTWAVVWRAFSSSTKRSLLLALALKLICPPPILWVYITIS